jgi:hypothetical protein
VLNGHFARRSTVDLTISDDEDGGSKAGGVAAQVFRVSLDIFQRDNLTFYAVVLRS